MVPKKQKNYVVNRICSSCCFLFFCRITKKYIVFRSI